VLRKDGVLWLNLGDSYLSATDGRNGNNLKPKDLVGIPWRVAFALQDDGWWLRSDIIWAKTNPMPESVRDRPTRAHEYIFMLTKRARYYWNKEGAREPAVTGKWEAMPPIGDVKHLDNGNRTYSGNCPPGNGNRNMRDVWTMNTGRYRGAHFATFPEILAKKCIMASTRAGDMVFDPFGGTGTTVATAIALGRRGTMLEINKDYCELAQQRLARAQPGMW